MKRIAGATVDANLFGTGKDGFTSGQPGVKAATNVTPTFLNSVQEEICTVIEGSGVSLNVADNTQLLTAVLEHANREGGIRAIGVAIASHVSRTAPTAVNYRKVAYGDATDPIFVATNDGASGPHTSVDGVTWANRSVTALLDVCYEQGRFLCVGPAAALVTSENGTAYTARTPGGGFVGAFYCCAASGALFVAAGENGEIQTSANGTSGWTHRTPASGFAGTWYGAGYGGGVFVLVGLAAPDVITIQTSPDGTTWTTITPSETNGLVYDVANGNGVWIAVGSATVIGPGLFMRSTDSGATWVNVTAPSAHVGYFAIEYDSAQDLFVAVGGGGAIAISRDGSEGSWRDVSRASFATALQGVAFGDGTCVIAGNTSALRQSLSFPWNY